MDNTKGLTAFIETHPKTVFWARCALWAICAAVIPFLFIALRYQLFEKVSSVQVSGWGMMAIVIVAIFLITVIKYIKALMKIKYTFVGQCIDGVCKVIIPLAALLLITTVLGKNINVFIQSLKCVLLCEMVAIPLNPFPKFLYDSGMEKGKNMIDYLLNKKEEKEK